MMNIYPRSLIKKTKCVLFKREHLNDVIYEEYGETELSTDPSVRWKRNVWPRGPCSQPGIWASRAASGCCPFWPLGPFLCPVGGRLLIGWQLLAPALCGQLVLIVQGCAGLGLEKECLGNLHHCCGPKSACFLSQR